MHAVSKADVVDDASEWTTVLGLFLLVSVADTLGW